MLTKKQLITKINKLSWNNALLYITLRYKQRVFKGFEAFSKDRKRAANAFRNPLETQFQVVSRGLKLFENALETLWNSVQTLLNSLETLYKPFGSPLKTRFWEFETLRNSLQTLGKLFTNRLEALYKPGFRNLKPFGNPVSGVWNPLEIFLKPHFTRIVMFNKTCFRMEGHICPQFALVSGLHENWCIVTPWVYSLCFYNLFGFCSQLHGIRLCIYCVFEPKLLTNQQDDVTNCVLVMWPSLGRGAKRTKFWAENWQIETVVTSRCFIIILSNSQFRVFE